MKPLTVIVFSAGVPLCLLLSLTVYTLWKFFKRRLCASQSAKKENISVANHIHDYAPISYRTLKAQAPFLKQEEYWDKTLPRSPSGFGFKPNNHFTDRKYSAPAAFLQYQQSIHRTNTDMLDDALKIEPFEFERKQRKISQGALEHLMRQCRRVSEIDIRVSPVSEETDYDLTRSNSSSSTELSANTEDDSSVNYPLNMNGKLASKPMSYSPVHKQPVQENKKSFRNAGKILLRTQYNSKEKRVYLHVLKVLGIADGRNSGEINPFVKTCLLPGKKQKQSTNYKRNTKQPLYDKMMTFEGMKAEHFHFYRLKIKVVNHSRLRKKEILGEIDFSLSSITIDNEESFWLDLFLQRSQSSVSSICVSMCHQAARGKLIVQVVKARHLCRHANSYISLTLFRETSFERKDTSVRRSTSSPDYNETIEFDVSTDRAEPLGVFTLVATINNAMLVGKDQVLGHVIFSLTSRQKTAAEHWKITQDAPHQLHTEWHSLLEPSEL